MDKSANDIESQILRITRQFLMDSGAKRALSVVTLNSYLESELGLGSLERSELFNRIEKSFGIQLSDRVIMGAKQLKDILPAVISAKPRSIPIKSESVVALDASLADPSEAATLVEVLQCYAKTDPNRPHIYLQNEAGEEKIISYGELYGMAQRVAQGLFEKGLRPTETVAIMLPTSAEFFYMFFGVLLVGAIPVPIYPPFRSDQIEAYAKREALILRNAGVRFLVTFQEAEGLSKLLKAFIPSLLAVTTVHALLRQSVNLPVVDLNDRDFALIQYTSGSTGNPKGVLLNHGNLLANIRAYGDAIEIQPQDVFVSWLPLYHDMGLIGAWLGSLYYGVPLTLLSPLSFLSRPERWLWAIHYHRATMSAGPNFAYELCLKKIDDAALEGLDLSSWRLAFNGAEMIYPKTLRNFIKRFKAYGFKESAFLPVYGLAETALALTFPNIHQGFHVDRIQRETFEQENKAIPAAGDEKKYSEFVSCGRPLDHHAVRIVSGDHRVLGERFVGRIQFQGPSVMQGYYKNPDATKAIYHDGWWESGDLGYLAEGELYITGREKDLIIKAGRNYYPTEIEEAVNLCEGVRKGCVAAFGVRDERTGTEKIIIVAETNSLNRVEQAQIRKDILGKIVSQFGISPDEIFLARTHVIPKTSSGKLRRSECKQAYLTGQLSRRGLSATTQIIKLFLHSAWKRSRKGIAQVAKSVFTGYVAAVVIATLLPCWGLMTLLPKRWAQKCLHFWCRSLFRLIFCPVRLRQLDSLEQQGSAILVSNHSSYLDILILLALFPNRISFVGKEEILRMPFVKRFIKYIHFIPIDRIDFSKNEQDIDQIKKALLQNKIVALFPEGTFSYATGIRPFKSGAFKIAVEMGCAIYPMAIRGARKIWRANSYLLRPAILTVTVCEPLISKHKEWSEVVRLRERSRELISEHSGEQPVDFIFASIARQ